MLRSPILLLAAVSSAVLGLAAVGCGDDSSSTSGAGGSGSTSTGAGAGTTELTKPPSAPEGAGPGDGTGVVLGVSRLYLGDTDRAGTTSLQAWRTYGYDLDGVATTDTTDLAGHCTPVGGEVNAANLEDGDGGIDNSFGKNILGFIGGVLPDPSVTATEAIQDGSFTIALDMTTLGAGTDYNPVATNLFAAVDKDPATGEWKLVRELLNNDDPNSPKIQFPTAYVNGNTWVSGAPQKINLSLNVGGVDLSLDINAAVITLDLNASHDGATNGTIAGVLDTEAFVRELGEVAGSLAGESTDFCPGAPLFESVVQNIRNASDIMANGAQQAGVTCTGISIALGFDANVVELGGLADPAEVTPSQCPEQ